MDSRYADCHTDFICQTNGSRAKGWLPIWSHFSLSIILFTAGVVGAFVGGGIATCEIALFNPRIYVFVPGFVMHRLIPARCRACGGRCWRRVTANLRTPKVRSLDTFKYYCEHCCGVVYTRCGGGSPSGGER